MSCLPDESNESYEQLVEQLLERVRRSLGPGFARGSSRSRRAAAGATRRARVAGAANRPGEPGGSATRLDPVGGSAATDPRAGGTVCRRDDRPLPRAARTRPRRLWDRLPGVRFGHRPAGGSQVAATRGAGHAGTGSRVSCAKRKRPGASITRTCCRFTKPRKMAACVTWSRPIVAACRWPSGLPSSGPVPPHDVAQLGASLADGAGVRHEAGVLHRDIKPANILLDLSATEVTSDRETAQAAAAGDVRAKADGFRTGQVAAIERAGNAHRDAGRNAHLHGARTGDGPLLPTCGRTSIRWAW